MKAERPWADFDAALLQEIQSLCEAKRQRGIEPAHITTAEVMRRVKAALNALYKDGYIVVGDTLNEKWIKPNEQVRPSAPSEFRRAAKED